jgi:hypothetical protein
MFPIDVLKFSEFRTMRNAVAHTARLTKSAQNKLASVYENIQGSLKTLLFDGS